MSNELLLALVGILGTLGGTFAGSLFSFLSLKRQFSQSIRTIRLNRTFDSYENLLEIIIAAQVHMTYADKGVQHRLSTILYESTQFRAWYPEYLQAWHQKKYLLDLKSLTACEKLAAFIIDLNNEYPGFRAESKDKPQIETLSKLFEIHMRFFDLLSECYESLRAYLLSGIEKE